MHNASDTLLKIFFTMNCLATYFMILEMIPDQFARVELWRIWRQIKQTKHSFSFLHKLFYFFRSMYRMVVNYEVNRPFRICNQSAKKLTKYKSVHPFFCCHIKRIVPLGLIAEIKFILKREPVVVTTGVCPLGAHVQPE